MSERTERNRRYAKSEKGKERRAVAQAKWRQSKPKGKRGPKPRVAVAGYYDSRTTLEECEAEKQAKRREFERNPPVQAPTEESRDMQVHRLMRLFEPRRGFLTKKTRTLLRGGLMCSNPLFDSIVERLAKDFLSNRPIERWLKLLDVLRFGESDSYEPTKFYSRAELDSLMNWGRGMNREYFEELRERKAQRESALLQIIGALRGTRVLW